MTNEEKAKWIIDNYSSIDSDLTYSGPVNELSYEQLSDCLIGICFGKNIDVDKMIESVKDLSNLKYIDFFEYESQQDDLDFKKIKCLIDKGIDIIFNKRIEYKDQLIYKFIYEKDIQDLEKEKFQLESKLEMVNFNIENLKRLINKIETDN